MVFAFVLSIEKALENANDLKTLSVHSADFVQDFTWGIHFETYVSQYRQLISDVKYNPTCTTNNKLAGAFYESARYWTHYRTRYLQSLVERFL